MNEAGAPDSSHRDTTDYCIAVLIAICAAAVFVRTLAPDLLYGDSAEFQTLAYTLGMTHSTGYPVYLLLARAVGLLPVGTPAWRVSLFSAVTAALTVGGVYLLARHLTTSRVGALIGAIALTFSYTFWSQAIIAEVYTPATACAVIALLLLWRWHGKPHRHSVALAVACLLMGAGLGIHASVGLFIPPAGAFILYNVLSRGLTHPARALGIAVGSGLLGLALFVGTFVLIDLHNPSSSFINVTIRPSRSVWGLTPADLDSPLERFWITVSGLQWRDAMFPDGGSSWITDMWAGAGAYADRLLTNEFTWVTVGCALLGAAYAVKAHPVLGWFLVGCFTFTLVAVLNYNPPDWHVFLLPTYIPLTVATGVGVGQVLKGVLMISGEGRGARLAYSALVALLLLGVMISPYIATRCDAVRTGIAWFSEEHYVYPVNQPEEPRQLATVRLMRLPDGALLLLDWRALYTTYYMAHVEGMRPQIEIKEATPHGSEGLLAESLLTTVEEALAAGQPVYSDHAHDQLRQRFRVWPAPGGGMYQIRLRRTN
ncbi:MAG: glycosyltransferase family 117 protein [Anaerolineae bacterium]